MSTLTVDMGDQTQNLQAGSRNILGTILSTSNNITIGLLIKNCLVNYPGQQNGLQTTGPV